MEVGSGMTSQGEEEEVRGSRGKLRNRNKEGKR